ncbi:putative Histone acetyltransferase esa1 [Paratrimastix pyriformis]|uniref:histone acetyltransferase n=1 Tax=Paratrimastix pyriformis TaxID=342808 RepID=A0ABQ8U6Q4_9EUKA|nr:putative Histone acetyltransferase esa1 [Paratrimastix pyriformis]
MTQSGGIDLIPQDPHGSKTLGRHPISHTATTEAGTKLTLPTKRTVSHTQLRLDIAIGSKKWKARYQGDEFVECEVLDRRAAAGGTFDYYVHFKDCLSIGFLAGHLMVFSIDFAFSSKRVRNIEWITFGRYEMQPWYFSPYPKDLLVDGRADRLLVCEFCLTPLRSRQALERHMVRFRCVLIGVLAWRGVRPTAPCDTPGDEIYRHEGNLSFFEVDGDRERQYARNLCLLSRLFLDHKMLTWDVDPSCSTSSARRMNADAIWWDTSQRSGDSSRGVGGADEKEAAGNYNYNLSCIMTLPPFQKKGYGKLLISFSYELSKKENKVGTPERPLSDLGLLTYRSYWEDVLVEILCNATEPLSLQDLSDMTCFTIDDVETTLKESHILQYRKGAHYFMLSPRTIDHHKKRVAKHPMPRIDPQALHWTPLVVQDQRT